MSTVAEVLGWALRDAGVMGEGETASAATTSDAFETLKQLMALWQVENVFVYAQSESSFVPTGAVSYTVGTLGTVAISRPAKILSAFWRLNALDYPIEILQTFEEYQTIVQKTQAGEPDLLYYNPSFSLGRLYLHPQPSTGAVHLITQTKFADLEGTATDMSLPPEYTMPIRTNLAVLLCGMFGTPLRPEIEAMARASWKIVKRNNLRIQPLGMPLELPGYRRGNIIAGY